MQKSLLLNYIFEEANKLKIADGKKALSANYFFVSLLRVLALKVKNELPEELNGCESLKELDDVNTLFEKHSFDLQETAKKILEIVQSKDYNSSMDEFVFNKINYDLESKAKKLNREAIDAYVVAKLAIEEPTQAIKSTILATESATESETVDNDTSASTGAQKIEELRAQLLAELDLATAKSDRKTEIIAEETGMQRLSKTITETRDIQKFLLDNIFGQDQAVNSFVSGYFQSKLMAQSRKGIQKSQAMFLFAGPPGVGKTFLAEKAAEALKLPFKRFDMSEYSDKEANLEFCGSDKVYKNGKPGNVTSFVDENPNCVLLFDEIEKAHINIIYLFLQILDAGRIRDNYTDEEISFTNAVIIFTTNVGKNLYNDSSIANLASLSRKKILRALSTDLNPETNAPLFPAAICSRFASGNVVMFNHLGVNNLFTIANRELQKNIKGFEESTGIKINVNEKVATAIILLEGGKADARTVKGRANAFFHEELYELFRLLSSDPETVRNIQTIKVDVSIEKEDEGISQMFVNSKKPGVLLFANKTELLKTGVGLNGVDCFITDKIDEAKEILFGNDISIIVCDVTCQQRNNKKKVLNLEDVKSDGMEFLSYALSKHTVPVYLMQYDKGDIRQEEFLSFAKIGVQDLLVVNSNKKNSFEKQILEKCNIAYQQDNILKLARANKVLQYKTAQSISKSRKTAEIKLFDFKLNLAADIEDSKNILDNISKPDVRFNDVIGAEDAKKELQYFVQYLKEPIKFIRKGVRSPKGVLLYGPPGTGKTLLAKAMAGESDVTFLTAEGNQFLKKFVGEGADAIHSLFNVARKYAPAIVFIDEIDAIGKNREQIGQNDTTSDVLTALLTEMDGFNTDTTKPVFVLAATNYSIDNSSAKSLDPALTRRFDRRIYVDLPTKEERKRFLNLKASKNSIVSLSEDQLENIAIRSTGMSLAELDSVCEMALRNAVRTEGCFVDDVAFEEAFETFNSGEKKQWAQGMLLRTARHEAGHALLCWLGGENPSYLTIVARGDHGGYMQHADNEDKGLYTKDELLNRVRTSLAGRACELVYYGETDGVSTGASGDLCTATRIAEQMICKYGMDEEIGLSYISENDANSLYFNEIRKRVNVILSNELKNTIDIVSKNKKAIDALVGALMEKNHLKEKDIDNILNSNIDN